MMGTFGGEKLVAGRTWLVMVMIASWQLEQQISTAFRAPTNPVANTFSSADRILGQSTSSSRLRNYDRDASNVGYYGFRGQDVMRISVACEASGGVVAAGAGLATPTISTMSDASLATEFRLQQVIVFLWATLKMLFQAIAPSRMELKVSVRLTVAALLGMTIGFERRTSNRPAGIRTMSLVAIGACIFTTVSQYGFSRADQARVAASVASGVGFIGAGVITTAGKGNARGREKTTDLDGDVRGLTTASAIWITAGLGMACGTGLLFTATVGTVLTVAILKISRLQETFSKLYHLRDILKLRSDQNQVPVPAAVTAADVSDRQDVVPAEKDAHDVQGRSEVNGDKTAPEGVDEESRQESSADVAEARSSPKANALETGRKTTDPVDGTPLSWEERSEVGEDVGDEDDYGDDGDVVDSRDMYHDDPFFGGTWPGVLPKAKPWVPDGSPPVPAPTRTTRKRSRVISSRKRWQHSRAGGLHFVRPPASSAIERTPPEDEPVSTHRGGDASGSVDGESKTNIQSVHGVVEAEGGANFTSPATISEGTLEGERAGSGETFEDVLCAAETQMGAESRAKPTGNRARQVRRSDGPNDATGETVEAAGTELA